MSNPFEQIPFDGAEFVDNPEPRCPCLLLLDVSGSMRGRPLKELNEGLVQFKDELYADSLASKRVEIGLVSFGPVSIVNDFTSVQNWIVPELSAQGDTPNHGKRGRSIPRLLDNAGDDRSRGIRSECEAEVGNGVSHLCFATRVFAQPDRNSAGECSYIR